MKEQEEETNNPNIYGIITVPNNNNTTRVVGSSGAFKERHEEDEEVISALTPITGVDSITTESENNNAYYVTTTTTPKVAKKVGHSFDDQYYDPSGDDYFSPRLVLRRSMDTTTDDEDNNVRIYGRQEQFENLESCFRKTTKTTNSGEGDGVNDGLDRQLILLEGTAGSGKSSLVHQWKQRVLDEGGFFLGGKYEQGSGSSGDGFMNSSSGGGAATDEPYVAVTMACRELCDGLLAHRRSQDQQNQRDRDNVGSGCYSPKWTFTFDQVQAKLQEELEPDVIQVLTTVFPDLMQLFGGNFLSGTASPSTKQQDQPDENDTATTNTTSNHNNNTNNNNNNDPPTKAIGMIGYNEAKEQFKYAIRRLIRVIASFGRIVLFLDDCQWADAASLDLVKNCITDCRTVVTASTNDSKDKNESSSSSPEEKEEQEEMGLMLIAAYRSEEVNDGHGLMKMVQQIEEELGSSNSSGDTVTTTQQPNNDDSTGTKFSYEISKILVHNLQMEQVHEIVRDVFRRGGSSSSGSSNAKNNNNTLEETSSLAKCIFSKTEGNPLYVIQFLESLMISSSSPPQQQQQTEASPPITPLLRYNPTLLKWEFDIEEIRLSASAAQNVVEMIQQKMKRLPLGFQKLLPVVALLGVSFDYSLLDRVVRHFNHQIFRFQNNNNNTRSSNNQKNSEEESSGTIRALAPEEFVVLGEKEGVLLMNRAQRKVIFGHDKIREAAFDLVPSRRDLAKLGMQLGRFFMTSFTPEEQDKNVFIMVNLLTGDSDSYRAMTTDNRVFLAELNCKAGIKALRGSAFASAEVYLERGVALLPEGHWYDQHDLSLELYSSAAEVYYANGKFEEAERCCQNIYEQVCSNTLETARANLVTLNVLNSKEQTDLAQQECIRILAELGCKFPKYGQGLFTVGGIVKIEMTVKSLEKQIQGLPVMADPTKQWIMRLLDRLATYAYQNKSDIFVLVILKALQYTLKYGSCDYTPPALSTVGMLLGGVIGDHDGNNRFGKLALEQYNKSPPISRTAYARTIMLAYAFNCHTHISTRESRKQYLEVFKTAMACGDIESAFYLAISYAETGLHVGEPLASLEREIHAYTKQSIALKQQKVAILLFPIWECVTNLLGYTDSLHDMENALRARVFNSLGVTEQSLSEHAMGVFTRLTFHNLFYMGQYEEVASMCIKHSIDKLKWDTGVHMCVYALEQVHFHCAIALFATFHDTKQKMYKKLALKEAKITKGRCKWGNPCHQHYISFVEAEQLALDRKSFSKAVELFQEAIRLTVEQKVVHDQALANERLGELYLRNDKESEAIIHFRQAENLYEQWGSAPRRDVVFSSERRKKLLTSPVVDQSSKLAPTLPLSDIMLVMDANDEN